MRNRVVHFPRIVMLVALTAICALPPGARGAGKQKQATAPAAVDPQNLVWPLPPDKPRLKFLEMYSNNFDIEPRKKKTWVDKMVGNADPNKTEVFQRIAGIATDSKGRILLASSQNATVYVLDKDHKEVLRLQGDRGIYFRVPVGLVVDGHDNFFVSDPMLHMVLKFDRQGHLLATLGQKPDLKNPAFMALDEIRRRLFVVDSHLHQVLVYNLDTLEFMSAVGNRGTKDGEFNFPVGIAVNREGYFAVTDTGSCSVQIFSPDLKFVRRFGSQGISPGNFIRPKGVAFDSEDNIWVVDAAFNNFQIFNPKGTVLMFVGNYGNAPGSFNLPMGIYIDNQDRVYVGDGLNSRVQIFQFLGGKQESASH